MHDYCEHMIFDRMWRKFIVKSNSLVVCTYRHTHRNYITREPLFKTSVTSTLIQFDCMIMEQSNAKNEGSINLYSVPGLGSFSHNNLCQGHLTVCWGLGGGWSNFYRDCWIFHLQGGLWTTKILKHFMFLKIVYLLK